LEIVAFYKLVQVDGKELKRNQQVISELEMVLYLYNVIHVLRVVVA